MSTELIGTRSPCVVERQEIDLDTPRGQAIKVCKYGEVDSHGVRRCKCPSAVEERGFIHCKPVNVVTWANYYDFVESQKS